MTTNHIKTITKRCDSWLNIRWLIKVYTCVYASLTLMKFAASSCVYGELAVFSLPGDRGSSYGANPQLSPLWVFSVGRNLVEAEPRLVSSSLSATDTIAAIWHFGKRKLDPNKTYHLFPMLMCSGVGSFAPWGGVPLWAWPHVKTVNRTVCAVNGGTIPYLCLVLPIVFKVNSSLHFLTDYHDYRLKLHAHMHTRRYTRMHTFVSEHTHAKLTKQTVCDPLKSSSKWPRATFISHTLTHVHALLTSHGYCSVRADLHTYFDVACCLCLRLCSVIHSPCSFCRY